MSERQPGDELLTPGEAAAPLVVEPRTVTRWSESGKLGSIRTPGGHRRFLKSDVLAMVNGHPASQESASVPSPRGSTEDGGQNREAAAAVVADAVAIALEVQAEEAARAVVVITSAVAEAAAKATEAAALAQGARAVAAEVAATAVARDAARTATRVHIRAEVAANQVAHAAAIAAEALGEKPRPTEGSGAARIAITLAATVEAAAQATAQDTARAAASVASDVASAAAQVARTVAEVEDALQGEVTATADALQDVTTRAAEQMAAETRARAAGAAMAAREAAKALRAPVGRDDDHAAGTTEILAAAAERDAKAELRDQVAEEREGGASLRSFLPEEQEEVFDATLRARRAAATDRSNAKADRASAASDRAALSDHLSPRSGDGGVSGRHMFELAAEFSHDLRVPLSSITASMEMLEDELRGHSDRTVAALLGSAKRAGDRMVRMLDQNMTPPTPGEPLAMPEVDLDEVVGQLLLDSAAVLELAGAVVETGELPVVRADPDEMYSVLQNLLTNSVKFARPGVPAIVRISARRSVDGWRISVRDNGVGLPDNSGLDVFSLFSRGTSAVTGHGIGLATVARIVAAHGGRVGAATVETGAEIWFELPEHELVMQDTADIGSSGKCSDDSEHGTRVDRDEASQVSSGSSAVRQPSDKQSD